MLVIMKLWWLKADVVQMVEYHEKRIDEIIMHKLYYECLSVSQ